MVESGDAKLMTSWSRGCSKVIYSEWRKKLENPTVGDLRMRRFFKFLFSPPFFPFLFLCLFFIAEAFLVRS